MHVMGTLSNSHTQQSYFSHSEFSPQCTVSASTFEDFYCFSNRHRICCAMTKMTQNISIKRKETLFSPGKKVSSQHVSLFHYLHFNTAHSLQIQHSGRIILRKTQAVTGWRRKKKTKTRRNLFLALNELFRISHADLHHSFPRVRC